MLRQRHFVWCGTGRRSSRTVPAPPADTWMLPAWFAKVISHEDRCRRAVSARRAVRRGGPYRGPATWSIDGGVGLGDCWRSSAHGSGDLAASIPATSSWSASSASTAPRQKQHHQFRRRSLRPDRLRFHTMTTLIRAETEPRKSTERLEEFRVSKSPR